ncbi:hypothetical protein HRG_000830 [Hirsutella rhossiliensis]|uniref:Uncharacterized protein n=1 Tax=Hirsutella rhossiliensis TaxID=111463 RepID=A0A9P8N5U6_9HYPO|nr:uncharacterized protein HRG_00830 [Hirsutella rhossiliensis]KAH0968188.1 hypothetical protein HRG_00830 [Hirsutella rhossiliensis]
MLVKQFLVAALFTMGSVTALPEADPGNAMASDRRCNNDRWAYWDDKHRGCSCRSPAFRLRQHMKRNSTLHEFMGIAFASGWSVFSIALKLYNRRHNAD